MKIIDMFIIIAIIVNAVMNFTGYGINRISAGLGWSLALMWLLIAKGYLSN